MLYSQQIRSHTQLGDSHSLRLSLPSSKWKSERSWQALYFRNAFRSVAKL